MGTPEAGGLPYEGHVRKYLVSYLSKYFVIAIWGITIQWANATDEIYSIFELVHSLGIYIDSDRLKDENEGPHYIDHVTYRRGDEV